jgi:diacylglycerol kinase family enzyme
VEGVAVKRILVVVNPMARRDASRLLTDFRDAAPDDIAWDVVETTPQPFQFGDLESAARASDVVVAVGGDGTVADVLTAIGDAGVPVAILRGGSTNVIAQELGISGHPSDVAEMVFGRHVIHTMDAATCNDRLFLHMAGAGFDSRIFDQTNPALKRRVGWLAYLPGAARSLRLPPARFHVRTESAEFDITSPMVLVANGGGIIRPSFRLLPDIASDDGWLDLVAVTTSHAPGIASVLGRFATGSLQRSPHVMHVRARTVQIEADPEMPIQIDGDVAGTTPVKMEILPGRAKMMVPYTGDPEGNRGSATEA